MKNRILLSTAGGGKTTALIDRIQKLESDKILVLSFTRVACDEILRRSNNKNIDVCTLHSFCMKIMNKNYLLITDMKYLVTMCNDTDLSDDLIVELCSVYDKSSKLDPPAHLKEVYEYNQKFIRVFNRINEEKEKSHIYFFSDILHDFMNNIEDYLPSIYERYDHICVDEAQDLSPLQWSIVMRIIEECFNERGKTFFVVGDRKQIIYDFQGSTQELYDANISRLVSLGAVVENSNTTYRFGGDIAKLLTSEFEIHNSNKSEGVVIIDKVIGTQVVKHVHNLFLCLLSKYDREDILFLYARQNRYVQAIQELSLNLGSNFKVYLNDNVIVSALWNIFHYTVTKSDYYKALVIQGPFVRVKEPNFYYLVKTGLFKTYNDLLFTYFCENAHDAEKIMSILIGHKIECSNIDKLVLEQLYIMANGSLGSLLLNLPDFIYVKTPGIKCSTIHSAKGMESKVVVYLKDDNFSITKTYYANYFVLHSPIERSISLNLDYVAKSRAKDLLHIVEVM